jgi:hypothetical protein
MAWMRTAFLCLLSAAAGSAATIYLLRTKAPIIIRQPNPNSRAVQFAQVQGPSGLIVVDGDTV